MTQPTMDEMRAQRDAIAVAPAAPGLSADRRRTAKQKAQLEAGVHPATRRPLLGDRESTCGDCEHHTALKHHDKRDLHYLGGWTRSASSDIRVSWPACDLFEAAS